MSNIELTKFEAGDLVKYFPDNRGHGVVLAATDYQSPFSKRMSDDQRLKIRWFNVGQRATMHYNKNIDLVARGKNEAP